MTGAKEFQEKHGFKTQFLPDVKSRKAADEWLKRSGNALIRIADACLKSALLEEQQNDDTRVYRAHLMIEELGEIMCALADKDETALADGCADLMYVTDGTAASYHIPMKQVLEEVHRSNMTKQLRKEGDKRMRDKGSGYSKPDIPSAISKGREEYEII